MNFIRVRTQLSKVLLVRVRGKIMRLMQGGDDGVSGRGVVPAEALLMVQPQLQHLHAERKPLLQRSCC